MQCLTCSKLTINLKFCSKSCSAKMSNLNRVPRSKESKLKTSLALKGIKHPNRKASTYVHAKYSTIDFHDCIVCGSLISKPGKKTCSIECRDSIRSKNGTLKMRNAHNLAP